MNRTQKRFIENIPKESKFNNHNLVLCSNVLIALSQRDNLITLPFSIMHFSQTKVVFSCFLGHCNSYKKCQQVLAGTHMLKSPQEHIQLLAGSSTDTLTIHNIYSVF